MICFFVIISGDLFELRWGVNWGDFSPPHPFPHRVISLYCVLWISSRIYFLCSFFRRGINPLEKQQTTSRKLKSQMSTPQLQMLANKAVTPPSRPFKISLVNSPEKPAEICRKKCIVFNPMPRAHILVQREWNPDKVKHINNRDILRKATSKDIIKEGTRDIHSRGTTK